MVDDYEVCISELAREITMSGEYLSKERWNIVMKGAKRRKKKQRMFYVPKGCPSCFACHPARDRSKMGPVAENSLWQKKRSSQLWVPPAPRAAPWSARS